MAQMRSRREQVDAHKFITSRMNQALVLANPDSVERPLRRIGVSIFASVMIMVLVFGGFAIAALLGKGNDSPAFNHIIFEKGTNAIYVYTTPNGQQDHPDGPKLWPVTNYTSALLLLNDYQGEPPTQDLKPESLAGIERGFTVGIPKAPPSPPSAESLLQNEDWNACSLPVTAGGMNGRLLAELVVEDLEDPNYLGDEEFMLVQARPEGVDEDDEATGRMYVLWNDRKFEIRDEEVLNQLDIVGSQKVTVKEIVLETIPSGTDLAVDDPTGSFGQPSGVDFEEQELNFGQTVENGGDMYVLLPSEGDDNAEFAPIGEVSKLLLENATGLPTLSGVGTLTAEVGVQAQYEEDNYPQSLDEQRDLSGDQPALCSVFDPTISFEEEVDNHNPKIATFNLAPESMRTAAREVTLNEDGGIVDAVPQVAKTVLPPGTAAIAAAKPLETTTLDGIRFLVDSTGIKYGIVDMGTRGTGSTQALLGYGDTEPVGIPDPMLAMIGNGPPLDPEDARSQLDPEGDTPVYDSGEGEEGSGEGGEEGGE